MMQWGDSHEGRRRGKSLKMGADGEFDSTY